MEIRIKASLDDDVSGPLGRMRDGHVRLSNAKGIRAIGDAVRADPETTRMLGDALGAMSTEFGEARKPVVSGEGAR